VSPDANQHFTRPRGARGGMHGASLRGGPLCRAADAAGLFPFGESYASLAAFYGADARRWPSREYDFGLRWRGEDGSTYRAALVEATGELYLFEHVRAGGGGGMVFVLERHCGCARATVAFHGWQDVCGKAGSLKWFLARAAAAAGARADLVSH
jgi:hypothetical protein